MTLPFEDDLGTADFRIRSNSLDLVINHYGDLFERVKKSGIDCINMEGLYEIPLSNCHSGSLVLRKDGKFYNKESNEVIDLKDLPKFYENEDTFRAVHENMRSALLDFRNSVKKSLLDSLEK